MVINFKDFMNATNNHRYVTMLLMQKYVCLREGGGNAEKTQILELGVSFAWTPFMWLPSALWFCFVGFWLFFFFPCVFPMCSFMLLFT